MKRILIIILVSAGALSAQNKKLSLQEAIKIGMRESKEIKIQRSIEKEAGEKVWEVTSQMLPSLDFTASYMRLSDIPPFEVNVPMAQQPIRIQDAILNNYSMNLTLTQPLFTGFRLSSLKDAADYNKMAASQDLINKKNEVALKIQNAFWNLYKAEELLGLTKKSKSSVKKHLRGVKNFYENGMVTKNEVLKLKVRLSDIEYQIISAENRVEVARATLNKLLNYPISKEIELSGDEITVEQVNLELESLLEEASNNRKELQSTKYKIEAGKEQVDAEKADWMPSLYLFGNFNYDKPNQRIMPLEDEFNDTWNVGVQMQWDLWDWGNTSARKEQTKQKVFQAKESLKLLKDKIEIEVYNHYLTLKSELKKVKLYEQTVNQAEEDYRITKNQFENQTVSSSDLIDSEVAVLDAKTKLAAALADYKLAKAELEKALGRKIY
jgi:outer membrane protein TolC